MTDQTTPAAEPVTEPATDLQRAVRNAENAILRWSADRLREERSDYGPERFDGMVTAAERLDQWATDLTGTERIDYRSIDFVRVLGRGIVVKTAPQHALLGVGCLVSNTFQFMDGDHILIADQVTYQVTGYDPVMCALKLALVEDHRPGHTWKFEPPAEQAAAEDLTP